MLKGSGDQIKVKRLDGIPVRNADLNALVGPVGPRTDGQRLELPEGRQAFSGCLLERFSVDGVHGWNQGQQEKKHQTGGQHAIPTGWAHVLKTGPSRSKGLGSTAMPSEVRKSIDGGLNDQPWMLKLSRPRLV